MIYIPTKRAGVAKVTTPDATNKINKEAFNIFKTKAEQKCKKYDKKNKTGQDTKIIMIHKIFMKTRAQNDCVLKVGIGILLE